MDCASGSRPAKASVKVSWLLKDLVLRVESDRQPSYPNAIPLACDEIASSTQSAALRASQRVGDAGPDRDLEGQPLARQAAAALLGLSSLSRYSFGCCSAYFVSYMSD